MVIRGSRNVKSLNHSFWQHHQVNNLAGDIQTHLSLKKPENFMWVLTTHRLRVGRVRRHPLLQERQLEGAPHCVDKISRQLLTILWVILIWIHILRESLGKVHLWGRQDWQEQRYLNTVDCHHHVISMKIHMHSKKGS